MNKVTESIRRSDVVRLLGELDDLEIARIVASGASLAELEEAVAELEFEIENDDRPLERSKPRIYELRTLLRELLADELWDNEPQASS